MANAIFCRAAAILALSLAPHAWAQSVISAHSGVVDYIEGDVSIDGTAIHPKFAEFPDVKAGQLVATAEGRAEILLTPGVFLRMAENTSVRMLSNALADTRLEVVSGSAWSKSAHYWNTTPSPSTPRAHTWNWPRKVFIASTRARPTCGSIKDRRGLSQVREASPSIRVTRSISAPRSCRIPISMQKRPTSSFLEFCRAAANVTQQLKPNAIPGFHDDALYHTVGVK